MPVTVKSHKREVLSEIDARINGALTALGHEIVGKVVDYMNTRYAV